MKVTTQGFFPIIFYEFVFLQDQIISLCEEIQDKKEIIKKKYNDLPTDLAGGILDDYWTDFRDPIKLLEYERLIEKIPSQFLPKLHCEHHQYWTAIYEEKGYHSVHNHNPMLYDISPCNMSSILYLSDIGHTEFFNPRQSDEIHRKRSISSKMGKMIMFPSHILHHAIPHGKKDEERVIVSSNWYLKANMESIFSDTHYKENEK